MNFKNLIKNIKTFLTKDINNHSEDIGEDLNEKFAKEED